MFVKLLAFLLPFLSSLAVLASTPTCALFEQVYFNQVEPPVSYDCSEEIYCFVKNLALRFSEPELRDSSEVLFIYTRSAHAEHEPHKDLIEPLNLVSGFRAAWRYHVVLVSNGRTVFDPSYAIDGNIYSPSGAIELHTYFAKMFGARWTKTRYREASVAWKTSSFDELTGRQQWKAWDHLARINRQVLYVRRIPVLQYLRDHKNEGFNRKGRFCRADWLSAKCSRIPDIPLRKYLKQALVRAPLETLNKF